MLDQHGPFEHDTLGLMGCDPDQHLLTRRFGGDDDLFFAPLAVPVPLLLLPTIVFPLGREKEPPLTFKYPAALP